VSKRNGFADGKPVNRLFNLKEQRDTQIYLICLCYQSNPEIIFLTHNGKYKGHKY